MMRLTDTMLLATTKLRARKVRLIVTVVISSLLFGVLAVSSFVVRGVVRSTGSFAEEGFGKRYILSGGPINGSDYFEDKSVLDRAVALQKDQIARKKVEAKRLGIEYDSNSERLVYSEGDGPNGKQKFLDPSHPLATQAITEYLTAHPAPGIPELKKLGEPYGAIAVYESRYAAFGGPGVSGELKVLKEGKESFEQQTQDKSFNPFSSGLDSFNSSWSLMSNDLLQAFMLDGANSDIGADGTLPIVAPYSAVEQLLKLKPLPASASPATRLERLRDVRIRAGSVRFSVCYRNQTSSESINQAISTKQEMEQNKSNKNYQKPSLIYDLPAEPCGPARITRDVRTAEEKAIASKQQAFRQTFGEEAPSQTTLTFRIIGVSPDPPGFSAAFIDSLISSILSSNLGANWFVPLELRASNPVLAKFFPDQQLNGRPNSYYTELKTPEQAKQMLDKATCNIAFEGPPQLVEGQSGVMVDAASQTKACVAEGKGFFLNSFGSSSLALDQLQKGFAKVFRIAALIITLIAGVIMMGTLGRIIADSRRETAVFRAIGAKRLDVAQIYVTYALVLSVLIALTALLAGFGLSQLAEAKWGPKFTIQALVAYNAHDLDRQFHFYAWNTRDTLYIILAALAAGLISTIFPLIRNLRRNPIRDMRDEN